MTQCIPCEKYIYKYLKEYLSLIIAIMSMLIAYESLKISQESIKLVEKQQLQIYINNIVENIRHIDDINSNLKQELKEFKFELNNGIDKIKNSKKQLETRDIKIITLNKLRIIKDNITMRLSDLKLIYESLLVFQDSLPKTVEDKEDLVAIQYLKFLQNSDNLFINLNKVMTTIEKLHHEDKIITLSIINFKIPTTIYIKNIMLDYLNYKKLQSIKQNINKKFSQENLETIDIPISKEHFTKRAISNY